VKCGVKSPNERKPLKWGRPFTVIVTIVTVLWFKHLFLNVLLASSWLIFNLFVPKLDIVLAWVYSGSEPGSENKHLVVVEVKSLWPISVGLHTCHKGEYNELRRREL